jgi:hypothetical protein
VSPYDLHRASPSPFTVGLSRAHHREDDEVPLFEIDLPRAVFAEHHQAIGQALSLAQAEALDVPIDDVFQIFRPHDDEELKFDPHYNDVNRRSLLVIRITPVHIYRASEKANLFKAIVTRLEQIGIRNEDVLILISENAWEDWYAGRL